MKNRLQAPAAVRAQFKDWCRPKRGLSNPENQTNDVWTWLIQERAAPQSAHEAAGTGEQLYPGWCFQRYGQSGTCLPDGTKVYIGGEHEDHYDPDFYIYNDVVVVRPDASVEIFGYPAGVFPPTDFHSATLVGSAIYIIGGLRYPEYRNCGETQVYRLELSGFSIEHVEVRGAAPAWLYEHRAELDETGSRIICTGGYVTHHQVQRTVENLTCWGFDLETHTWSEAGTKAYTRWLLVREDEGWNDLYKIGRVVEDSRSSYRSRHAEAYRAKFEERGHVIDHDLYFSRFQPPVPHSPVAPVPDSKEYETHRIQVDGVIVRYVEDMHEISVTVEGALSADTVAALKQHGIETYSRLEGVPYKCVTL